MTSYYGARATAIRYGPDVPDDTELRLVGHIEGRRVLELGSGSRSSAAALARAGAHVIVVDPHEERLTEARIFAEDHEATAEWHRYEFSELAFLRADSIDVAFSAGALTEVEDVGRVFRQVHRVLAPGGHFIFSYTHPVSFAAGSSYFSDDSRRVEVDGVSVVEHRHRTSDVFTGLNRAGFRVEILAEPAPVSITVNLPTVIVWRAKKEGV